MPKKKPMKTGVRKSPMLTKEYYMKYWIMRLSDLACNMFPFHEVPEEINIYSMSKQIMLGGFAIFFYDQGLGKYFCLPGALTGVDVYGYPTTAKPIGKNTQIIFPELEVNKECVLIYANKIRTSALPYIHEYADKLSDLDLALKMNARAMKHPLMLKTTETMKESVATLMAQYEDDYYVVFPDKELLNETSVQTIDFKVSATEILNLQKEKESVLNEFFNVFGVSGSVEKRERMISGEMNAMMEQIAVNRQIWLSTQEDAVDRINRMYGLKMYIEVPKYMDEEEIKEEDKDKEVIKNEA